MNDDWLGDGEARILGEELRLSEEEILAGDEASRAWLAQRGLRPRVPNVAEAVEALDRRRQRERTEFQPNLPGWDADADAERTL